MMNVRETNVLSIMLILCAFLIFIGAKTIESRDAEITSLKSEVKRYRDLYLNGLEVYEPVECQDCYIIQMQATDIHSFDPISGGLNTSITNKNRTAQTQTNVSMFINE